MNNNRGERTNVRIGEREDFMRVGELLRDILEGDLANKRRSRGES